MADMTNTQQPQALATTPLSDIHGPLAGAVADFVTTATSGGHGNPTTDTQARADLIAQLDHSGIPQAVQSIHRRDEVVSEFAGNPQAMASAILQLRASLALARAPIHQTDQASAKHTSGGWNRNIPPARKYPVIFAGRNKHVCRLITDGMTDEEVEANANLIAAAPDMLEALHGSVRLLRAAGYVMEGTITWGINAAIAKATGGGPQG